MFSNDTKLMDFLLAALTVLRTIYGVLRGSKDGGTVENLHRSGRPSWLTERDSRRLVSVVKLN